jgi:hypothetical protein
MSGHRRCWVALLPTLCAVGCGADLGAGGGLEARSGAAVGYGRIAASTKLGTPTNDHGLLVGGSLESRAQEGLGARYDIGLMLGWGTGPAAIGGRWGLETFLEFGTPIENALFRHGNCFAGAAVATPYHFGTPRQVLDLNDATWIATSRLELVPMLRSRVHFDDASSGFTTKVDVTLGLALRLRIISDLL